MPAPHYSAFGLDRPPGSQKEEEEEEGKEEGRGDGEGEG